MATIFFAFLMSYVSLLTYGIPVEIVPSIQKVETTIRSNVNPEELGGGFEGDMILPGFDPKSLTRGVAVPTIHKWPHNIVPYDISAISDSKDRAMIVDAMNIIMYETSSPIMGSTARQTCVSFRPRVATDKTFLTIQYGNECSAHAGYYANFRLTMTLQKNSCFQSGVIQHELLHVLGFNHEQTRPDRDNYVQINFENIIPDAAYNFEKYVWGTSATNQGTPYDYDSIMHYGTGFFSKNGRPTIVPKRANVQIGVRQKMSAIDITEVRLFYGCKA